MSVEKMPKGVKVSGQGPAVVLLHSSLSSSRQWLPLVGLLKNDFTLINIDLLGYGQADKVDDADSYDFELEVSRIRYAIRLVAGDDKYHLVGHSCGGAIALKMAVEEPDKLLSVSLYEPVAFHLLPEGTAERAESDEFARQVLTKDPYTAAEVFTNFWNKPGFFRALPEKMQHLMAADIAKVNLDFKGLMAECYGLNDLSKVLCPSLLMSGEQSPYLSRHLTQLIQGAIPQASVQLFPAGHMAPVSHSDRVHPAIADFIKLAVPVCEP